LGSAMRGVLPIAPTNPSRGKVASEGFGTVR
jgi:hypothetical protein